MPAGAEVTVPAPGPSIETARLKVTAENDAVTDFAASIVTKQLSVPLHAPLQPANDEPVVGDAVRVTTVFSVKLSEQSVPQSMPAGEEITAPVPGPSIKIARLKVVAVVSDLLSPPLQPVIKMISSSKRLFLIRKYFMAGN